MPPGKRPSRETTVVHLTIDDTFENVSAVEIVMPVEAAADIIGNSLNLFRQLQEVVKKNKALQNDSAVCNAMAELDSSLSSGGVFIAVRAAQRADQSEPEL